MKSNLFRAALACLALAFTAAAALAGVGDPITGVPIGLEHEPGGIIAHGVTDGKGHVSFGKLAPGSYVFVIDGKGLVAAVEKLARSLPEKNRAAIVAAGATLQLEGGGLAISQRYLPDEAAMGFRFKFKVAENAKTQASETGVLIRFQWQLAL